MCNRQAACPARDGRNIPSTYSVNVSKTKPLAGLKPEERRKTQWLALAQSIIPLCYFDQQWYIIAETRVSLETCASSRGTHCSTS